MGAFNGAAFHLSVCLCVDLSGFNMDMAEEVPDINQVYPRLQHMHRFGVPLWHNKDKPENPCGARSWRLVLILFPLKNSFEMGSTGGGEKRGLHLKDKFSRARKDPSYEV